MTTPIRFEVQVADPQRHMIRVEMTIRGPEDQGALELALPVWTPGSYLVREYAQFVRVLRATDQDGDRREVTKLDKARWRVGSANAREITVVYEVYGHTLNVRYNHVEDDHAFLHGPALFMYPAGRLDDDVEVALEFPDGWAIWTGLRPIEGARHAFEAASFDELFDCPVLAGDLDAHAFEVDGTPHRFVFWGRGNHDPERIVEDTARIVEASASVFGGVIPYDEFDFLTLLTEDQYGGLEHRNSTALMYPRHKFVDPKSEAEYDDDYLDFLSLVSHEHFHVWNVKRIRPERLGPFDYQRENYTRDLWTVEGITSYYQYVSLLRAEIIDASKYLEYVAKQIQRLETVPGRQVSSLEDASWDTWIRLYRPHPHNLNRNVSYYLKGALAALALDVMIRVDTDGAKSLDDVMLYLWQHYSGEQGYPEGGYAAIVTEATGVDASEFFDVFVRGTEDPDWNDWLENIALRLEREVEPGTLPYVGWETKGAEVKAVRAGSPAEDAGISPGDRLVALDGWEVGDSPDDLLGDARPNVPVEVHCFRRGELMQFELVPGDPRPTKYTFEARDDADAHTLALLEGWLGTTDIGGDNDDEEDDASS